MFPAFRCLQCPIPGLPAFLIVRAHAHHPRRFNCASLSSGLFTPKPGTYSSSRLQSVPIKRTFLALSAAPADFSSRLPSQHLAPLDPLPNTPLEHTQRSHKFRSARRVQVHCKTYKVYRRITCSIATFNHIQDSLTQCIRKEARIYTA